MQSRIYENLILTVIAGSLLWICITGQRTTVVQAAPEPKTATMKVVIVGVAPEAKALPVAVQNRLDTNVVGIAGFAIPAKTTAQPVYGLPVLVVNK